MSSALPKVEVKLDWRAYFRAFCDSHGEPVQHEGRWLFPDGWTYALKDWAGPEWPPDLDRLPFLQRAYWRARRGIVKVELDHLKGRLNWLKGMAAAKSVPLKQRVTYRSENDDGEPVMVSEVKDLDLGAMEERAGWLAENLAECDANLKELGDGEDADGKAPDGAADRQGDAPAR